MSRRRPGRLARRQNGREPRFARFPLDPKGLDIGCDAAPYELEKGGVRYSVRVLMNGVKDIDDARKVASWLRRTLHAHMGIELVEVARTPGDVVQ